MFGLGTLELILLAIPCVLGLIIVGIAFSAYRRRKKMGRLEALEELSEHFGPPGSYPPPSPD